MKALGTQWHEFKKALQKRKAFFKRAEACVIRHNAILAFSPVQNQASMLDGKLCIRAKKCSALPVLK